VETDSICQNRVFSKNVCEARRETNCLLNAGRRAVTPSKTPWFWNNQFRKASVQIADDAPRVVASSANRCPQDYNHAHKWPSLLARNSDRMRLSLRSALGVWVRCIVRAIPGSIGRSRSKYFLRT